MDGKKLKRRMNNKRMSWYKLSKVSGISQSTICQITSGKRKSPELNTIKKLAAALECEIQDLI